MNKKFLTWFILGILALILLFAVNFLTFTPRLVKPPDSLRLSDLSTAKTALNYYRSIKGEPFPYVSGKTPQERWAQLTDFLLSFPESDRVLNQIPQDPKNIPPYFYDYQADSSGNQCIIKAVLENVSHPVWQDVLKNDVDGYVFGIDCGDPEGREGDPAYCIWCRDLVSEKSNWKTYLNKKQGFEFLHPPEFNISEDSGGYTVVSGPDSVFGLSFSPLWKRDPHSTLGQFIHNSSSYEEDVKFEMIFKDESTSSINDIAAYHFKQILGSSARQHTFFLKDENSGVDAAYIIAYFRYSGIGYNSNDKERFPDPAYARNPFIQELEQIILTFRFAP